MSEKDDGAAIEAQVQAVQQTEQRLAAAVEQLAYKKAHAKQEAIAVAQQKADLLLEKAEEKKDELVASLVDKLPSREEIHSAAHRVAAGVGAKAADVQEIAVERARDLEAAVAERIANVKEAGAQAVLEQEGGS
ncbi:MAG TPA: hypothetical protein VFW71_14735 [Actinomycetota bacterium]|nr:hypothetical protein [Actinomycetota bacterium]